MTLWRKQAVGFWHRPKIVAAGLDAGVVFQAVLDLAAELERDGVLLARDVEPVILASRCPLLRPKQVQRALAACLTIGLLERTEEGGLRITGWDDRWRPRRPESMDQGGSERRCRRCNEPAEPGLTLCVHHLGQDRERARQRRVRTSSTADALRTSTADSTADVHCGRTADVRTPSAVRPQFLNGTGTERRYPEREKREDQKRQELPESSSSEKPLSSENRNGGTASGTKGARAISALRIVRDLAAKLTDSEPDSRANRSGIAPDPRPILAPNAKETGRWSDR
ncbi:MAG: hypothetical protein IT377_24880 [Polyangiaceae bacterium]|nr:hypothetical protein [Polyangiaceae bacterium]